MIIGLIIIIAALSIGLWISVMALWWHNEQGHATLPVNRTEVIRQWNKAVRLGRRSWYGTLRYGKQATLWGNKKASTVFVAIFPKSKPAFVEKDLLTGLEHGPSSYFLANLSKATPIKKLMKIRQPRKKVAQAEMILEQEQHLSV